MAKDIADWQEMLETYKIQYRPMEVTSRSYMAVISKRIEGVIKDPILIDYDLLE